MGEALDAFDDGHGEFLGIQTAAGEPATVAMHLRPLHLHGAEAGDDGGLPWPLFLVEDKAGDAW